MEIQLGIVNRSGIECCGVLSEFSELSEDKFSAMGYGEFRPVGKNDTPEGRARNRRVEIYLDAFVTMEEVITVSPFPAP